MFSHRCVLEGDLTVLIGFLYIVTLDLKMLRTFMKSGIFDKLDSSLIENVECDWWSSRRETFMKHEGRVYLRKDLP